VEILYQRIWFDYALRDGTYTPEELRQAKKVVKPWGPVRSYRLVAVQQYSAPLGRWLLRDLAPLLDEKLSEKAVQQRGWFRAAEVARLLQEFRSGRRDYSLHLWALLVLEEWCRQYLDGNPS